MGTLITVEGLARLVESTALEHDVARAAVFDADGTIWRGDIGDEAFAHAHDEGLVSAETWERVREVASAWTSAVTDYKSLVELTLSGQLIKMAKQRGHDDDTFRSALYEMQAWVYAGHRRDAVRDYGDRIFQRGFGAGVFADVHRLLDALLKLDVTIVVVSASHGALIEASESLLGVKHMRGMEPALDEHGVTLPKIASSTYGPGKVRAALDVLDGRRPLLAFGDSVLFTDRALLASSQIPVAVNTSGAHRDFALAHERMLLLDPT